MITIPQLLEEIGIDNIRFQILSQVLDGNQQVVSKKRGGGIRLSFVTDEALTDVVSVLGEPTKRDALIVWVDRDKMLAAMERLKAVKL